MRKTGMIMKCIVCGEQGHNKRRCNLRVTEEPPPIHHPLQHKKKGKKQASLVTVNIPPASNDHAPPAPQMHQRGVGLMTYPNEFQRVTSINQPRRQAAYYIDYGGEQTLRSTTIMNDNAQLPSQSTQNSVTSSNHSFIAPKGRNYIYSQALQDLANKNRVLCNRD
ncbi:uncharacterized protein [Spinacia oleracea]|uniref:CCHC-type domain-containing protein n=1 Tax=Spinacia oleracea TaxID=3562 RepID=A0ABM3QIS5_SPIOL|nr:uncharacterized protein LOC130459744 [Spinacia oleracea]